MTFFAKRQFIRQNNFFAKALAVGTLFGLIVVLILTSNRFANNDKFLENNPLMYNLNDLIESSKVFFGEPDCGNEALCYISPKYDDSSWSKIVLGNSFRYYNEFDKNGGIVIHRFRFKIPALLFASNKALAIDLRNMNFLSSRVFLNGFEVTAVDGELAYNQTGVITLPRQHIGKDYQAQITFVSKYTKTSAGVGHNLVNYLGPKHILESEYIAFERESVSFLLMMACLKLSIFAVFVLLFIFSETQYFFKYFLLFAFLMGADSIFACRLTAEYLPFSIRAVFVFNFQFSIFCHCLIVVLNGNLIAKTRKDSKMANNCNGDFIKFLSLCKYKRIF